MQDAIHGIGRGLTKPHIFFSPPADLQTWGDVFELHGLADQALEGFKRQLMTIGATYAQRNHTAGMQYCISVQSTHVPRINGRLSELTASLATVTPTTPVGPDDYPAMLNAGLTASNLFSAVKQCVIELEEYVRKNQ